MSSVTRRKWNKPIPLGPLRGDAQAGPGVPKRATMPMMYPSSTAPIILNGFQRGGTNILQNLITSHPHTAPLDRETSEIFYGRSRDNLPGRALRRLATLPFWLTARQPYFAPDFLEGRRPLPGWVRGYVGLLIARHKQRSLPGDENPNRDPAWRGEERLVCKNVNGAAFTSVLFDRLYPQAVFVGLVRNGLAVCEGFVRRGFQAAEVGRMYEAVCQRMIADAAALPNYSLVRFDQILAGPYAFIQHLYPRLRLDLGQVNLFRLQAKKSMDASGKRAYAFGEQDREVHWFKPEELKGQLRGDVDDNQIQQLPPADREAFLTAAAPSMKYFGYF